MRRATALRQLQSALRRNFYPRSPCGERLLHASMYNIDIKNFYPRSPCGERPKRPKRIPVKSIFLSTLSLRRATSRTRIPAEFTADFYPRSPCGERQRAAQALSSQCCQFLSTLSLRRATFTWIFVSRCGFDFYPRSPCGERRVTVLGIQHRVGISIHALLAESDTC